MEIVLIYLEISLEMRSLKSNNAKFPNYSLWCEYIEREDLMWPWWGERTLEIPPVPLKIVFNDSSKISLLSWNKSFLIFFRIKPVSLGKFGLEYNMKDISCLLLLLKIPRVVLWYSYNSGITLFNVRHFSSKLSPNDVFNFSPVEGRSPATRGECNQTYFHPLISFLVTT